MTDMPKMAAHCPSDAVLRIEMNMRLTPDGIMDVELGTECPIDNFVETREAMVAAILHLRK